MTDIVIPVNLSIPGGKVTILNISGLDKCTSIDILDNAEALVENHVAQPTILGSMQSGIDAVYEQITLQFMTTLASSINASLSLRIDTLPLLPSITYDISSIVVTVDGLNVPTLVSQTATTTVCHNSPYTVFDKAQLKQVSVEYYDTLSRLAEDTAAWPVKYYIADVLSHVSVLSTYALKAINKVVTVDAFFPHGKPVGMLNFSQFGYEYDNLTNIHILVSTFQTAFGVGKRPSKNDIIYVEFLDQYFEIADITDVKTGVNTVYYYDIVLRLFTDRQGVAKDNDLLSVDSMINIDDYDTLTTEELPEIQSYAKLTWKTQILEKAQLVKLTDTNNYCIGIANYDNQWCKVTGQYGAYVIATLQDVELDTIAIEEAEELPMYFAKYAEFNDELSNFDRNMFLTAYNFVSTTKPLKLIDMVERA
jgi:hypothetical protein